MIQYDNANHGPVNTMIAFVCGILGGCIDYMVRADSLVIFAVFQAALTALICGFAGVAGKEFYLFMKSSFKSGKYKGFYFYLMIKKLKKRKDDKN